MRNLHQLLGPLCVLLVACGSEPEISLIEGVENETIYQTRSADAEMDEAQKMALDSFHLFVEAWNSPDTAFNQFSIKCRYGTELEGEHIWLSPTGSTGTTFIAVVDNIPYGDVGVKLGDTVVVDLASMTDWMYTHNDTLVGGYTLLAIRNKLSESQRLEFETGLGFHIKD